MSMVYCNKQDRYLDTDAHEAVELSNGDIVAISDDIGMIEAYRQGLLTLDEMLYYGFMEEDLDD